MVAPRCTFVKPTGQRCASFARRGKEFCFHHDPDVDAARAREERNAAGAETTNATATKRDAFLSGAVKIRLPKSRVGMRELLLRTMRDVLQGRLTPQRGKVVQDLARQALPLLPAEDEPANKRGDLSDEELLVELLREAEIVRGRIAAREAGAGHNGKGIEHGTAEARG